VEERSEFRPQTVASSLSISEEEAFSVPGALSGGGRSGSGDARFEGEYQSMRSALCASAPSHSYHVMPPRITRNSHRPRASDRTMVDTQSTVSLATLSSSMILATVNRDLPRMDKTQLLQRNGITVGWISRKFLVLSSRRSFFLDIPFYRLIERRAGILTADAS